MPVSEIEPNRIAPLSAVEIYADASENRRTVEIDTGQLLALLRSLTSATALSLVARVDARARKTGNPHGVIYRVSRLTGMVQWNYERAVLNQQLREGVEQPSFDLQPRAWGQRVLGTPLVEHKGRYYVEVKVERVLATAYENAAGDPLAEDDIRPWLPDRRSSAEHQGVEREVVLRDYAVDSIRSLTLGGVVYLHRA